MFLPCGRRALPAAFLRRSLLYPAGEYLRYFFLALPAAFLPRLKNGAAVILAGGMPRTYSQPDLLNK